MTNVERLERAWIEAGYPKEHMPKAQFLKTADHVAAAFEAGEADFIKVGWSRAGVDYPFAPSHPRYASLLEAYRRPGADQD